jgi:hypothetical protein
VSAEFAQRAYCDYPGHVVIRAGGCETGVELAIAERLLADLQAAVGQARKRTPLQKFFDPVPIKLTAGESCYFWPRFNQTLCKDLAHEIFEAGFNAGREAKQ